MAVRCAPTCSLSTDYSKVDIPDSQYKSVNFRGSGVHFFVHLLEGVHGRALRADVLLVEGRVLEGVLLRHDVLPARETCVIVIVISCVVIIVIYYYYRNHDCDYDCDHNYSDGLISSSPVFIEACARAAGI